MSDHDWMGVDRSTWLDANRALWDERAEVHAEPGTYYDVDGLVAGDDHLRPWEPDEVGPVDGLDLVHLQCHIGTDTLGWARRGARVVGLDFSPPALEAAAALFERAGQAGEWVCADVYDAAQALGGRTFDVVYTGIGAIGWLPDLDRWAQVVTSLLRPGGILYLYEVHPMWIALGDDGRTLREDAVGGAFQRWDVEEPGSYAAPDHEFAQRSTYEKLWSIAEVLTAVLDAGLAVELFHEWDRTPAPTGWLVRDDEGLYGFPTGAHRFPLTYSLRARRPVDRNS